MKHIKRSFCTTSFNTGTRLAAFLQSILPHLNDDDELILVDNHSNKETREIYHRYLEFFPNKFHVYPIKSNRGKGFDYAHRIATGDHLISVGSDVIFTDKLWTMLDKWFKERDSRSKVLFGVCCYVFPKEVYYAIGGYRHVNATEDTHLYNLLSRLDLVRFCEQEVGNNWTMKQHEARFVKGKGKILWRILMAEKDHIRMNDCMDLKDRLLKAKRFTNNGKTFYFFWIPLISCLSLYRLFTKKREFIRKEEWRFEI